MYHFLGNSVVRATPPSSGSGGDPDSAIEITICCARSARRKGLRLSVTVGGVEQRYRLADVHNYATERSSVPTNRF
jgi:hypothetical protein